MGFVLTVTTGLVIWIVLWALQTLSGFDAFIVAVAIMLVGATTKVLARYLPGRRDH